VFGFSQAAIVRRIMLPAILPQWVTALRTGLGLGFMFVLAAELLGASEGLGYLLLDGEQMGRADTVLVAMLTFAVLGKCADAALVALTRPLTRWQDLPRDVL
jgi:sulfonate transport system permease protein